MTVDASATPNGNVGDTTVDPNNQPPENVPYSKYRELLDEKKKEQAAHRAAQERVAEFERLQREKEEENAKKRGDFDKILSAREARIKELELENQASKERDIELRKLGAFLKSAGDVDQKWLGLVDVKTIATDPTTGEIDQMSVAQTVEAFKKNWPEAFKKPGVQIPTAAPNGTSGRISGTEYRKLSANEMKKYRFDQIDFSK